MLCQSQVLSTSSKSYMLILEQLQLNTGHYDQEIAQLQITDQIMPPRDEDTRTQTNKDINTKKISEYDQEIPQSQITAGTKRHRTETSTQQHEHTVK